MCLGLREAMQTRFFHNCKQGSKMVPSLSSQPSEDGAPRLLQRGGGSSTPSSSASSSSHRPGTAGWRVEADLVHGREVQSRGRRSLAGTSCTSGTTIRISPSCPSRRLELLTEPRLWCLRRHGPARVAVALGPIGVNRRAAQVGRPECVWVVIVHVLVTVDRRATRTRLQGLRRVVLRVLQWPSTMFTVHEYLPYLRYPEAAVGAAARGVPAAVAVAAG